MNITLLADNLRQIYKVCSAAAGNYPNRGIQSGVELTISDGILTATGCDGIRMHSTRLPFKGDDGTMVIPIIALPRGKYAVNIEQTGDSIAFTVKDRVEIYKCLEGNFVDWRKAIPQNEPIAEVLVNSTYMKEALAAFGTNKPVHIEIREGTKPIMLVSQDGSTQALVLPLRKGRDSNGASSH